MTAATMTLAASVRTDARLTFPRIVRSEWIKLTSLRSTVWSLGLIAVLGIGMSLAMASLGGWEASTPDPNLVLTITTVGVAFGQLIAAVLGVLVVSGEYSTGMIRSTLAAVPTRLPVLAAKTLVLFVLVTVVGAVTVFGAWAATYPLLATNNMAVGLGELEFTVALLGTAAYLGLTAVFALGVGTLLRSAAGGIAAALGVILVIPMIMPLLAMAFDWVTDLAPYMFSSAGAAMSSIAADSQAAANPLQPEQLEPWLGGVVVLIWTAVSLAVGAITLRRRDA